MHACDGQVSMNVLDIILTLFKVVIRGIKWALKAFDFHLNNWYLCLPTRTASRNHFPGWVTLHTLVLIFRLLQKKFGEYEDYQMKINFRTLERSARILWWRSPISPIKLIKNVLETIPLQFSFSALLFLMI